MTRKKMNRRTHRGFSMIELLVAVLVMGIGVLGVTGLQLVSLQNNRGSLVRAEAVQLAYGMLDRIRVNPGTGVPGTDYAGVDLEDDPPSANNCVQNTCSVAQMIDYDLALWKCSLGAHHEHSTCTGLRDGELLPAITRQPGLPDGDGAIDIDVNGVLTVTVQWTGFNGQVQMLSIDSQG